MHAQLWWQGSHPGALGSRPKAELWLALSPRMCLSKRYSALPDFRVPICTSWLHGHPVLSSVSPACSGNESQCSHTNGVIFVSGQFVLVQEWLLVAFFQV